MIFGSYLSVFVKKHVWLFLIAAIMFAVKPAITYFSGEEVQQPS